MRDWTRLFVWGSLIALIAVLYFGAYTKTQYTCLDCRATLQKRWILGIPVSRVVQNRYSHDVLSQDPAHKHKWCWCGTDLTYTPTSFVRACGRQHPIWQLPISVQADYAHLVSPAELHQTLAAIDAQDRTTAQATVQHVYETVINSH